MMLKIAYLAVALFSATATAADACTDVDCSAISGSSCQLNTEANNGYECKCATNFYDKDGTCTECPIGKEGDDCATCSNNYYGTDCALKRCALDQGGCAANHKCENAMDGANLHATNPPICTECEANTHLVGNSCDPCPEGKEGVNCATCSTDYYGTNCEFKRCALVTCNPNHKCEDAKDEDGNLSTSENHKCTVCPTNTQLVDNVCEACPANKAGVACADCAAGYTGADCTDIDECADDKFCGDNGTCANSPAGSFTCNCNDNYYGDKCEFAKCEAVDPCDDDKKVCTNVAAGVKANPTCPCKENLYGDACEFTKCAGNPCNENQNCADVLWADGEKKEAVCTCKENKYGDDCEYTFSAEKKFSLEETTDKAWDAKYSDIESDEYTTLVAALKLEISVKLNKSKKFYIKSDSLKIISVKSSAPGRRRRAANSAAATVVVEYEFVAKYDGAKITNAELLAEVSDKSGVAADKVSTSGASQLTAGLMAFGTMMMFL